MRIGLVTVILSFLFIKCLFAQPVPDIEMIKAKLHELSLIHSMGDQTKADQSVRSMMDNLNSEGKWPDINYNDRTHSKWLPSQHWFRLVDLSYQYNNKASEYFVNPVLLNVIKKGISWWLGAKPRADNFWWNAIGIPQQMGKVFMLMEKRLEDSIMVPGIKMMSMAVEPTHYEYHGPATGQNLLWLAAIHLHAACLQKDEAGINRAFSEIGKEIVVTDKEGIQEDFSFHQHGPMTYVFGYGKGFAESASQLMFFAHGTKWQLPREKVEILSRYILGGMQWMTRNDYLEYSAMGREISRQESNRKGEVVSALKYMMELDPSRKGQYEVFYHQLTEKKREKPLVGNRYFWRSDLMVHQRENYYFSIKATSDRIFSGESGNGENLKGFYHGHGTHYLIVQGNEYHDIFPVWDWRKLPGLLCSQRPGPLPLFDWGKGSKGTTTFAYGLSDSLYGCFGYDYKKDNVSAKKSWFLFDSEIIHLVSDASGDSLYQSINQELSDGEAWIEKGKNGYDRIYHGSTAYLIGGKGKTIVTKDIQTGSWKEIDMVQSAAPVSRKVFSLGIDLGDKVSGGSLWYAVLPGLSQEQFRKYRLQDHLKILSNTGLIQAVYQRDLEQVQAVFFQSGSLKLPWSEMVLEMTRPGLVILKKEQNKITVLTQEPESYHTYRSGVENISKGKVIK